MKLSVVILTYDQPEITVAHAKYCLASTKKPDELIIVNDGGPSIEQLLIDNQIKCTYAQIKEDIPWNQNGARNLGLFLATGDAIAIEDTDHIPTPTFYEEACAKLKEYDRVTCWYRLFVSSSDVVGKPIQEWNTRRRSSAIFMGVARREAINRIKGYDENLTGRYGWDAPDFVTRWQKAGLTSTTVGAYYMVDDAGTKVLKHEYTGEKKKMHPENYWVYRRNRQAGRTQSTKGILNFSYEIKQL